MSGFVAWLQVLSQIQIRTQTLKFMPDQKGWNLAGSGSVPLVIVYLKFYRQNLKKIFLFPNPPSLSLIVDKVKFKSE
jgi:hypothetical protein